MSVEIPLQSSLRDMHRAAVDEVNCWRGRCVDHFAQIEARMSEAITAVLAHPEGAKIKPPSLFGKHVERLKDAIGPKGPFASIGKDLRNALERSEPALRQRNMMVHATGRIMIDDSGSWAWLHQYQPTGKPLQRDVVTKEEASEREKEIRSSRDRLRVRIEQFIVRLNEKGVVTATSSLNSPVCLAFSPPPSGEGIMSETKGHGSHAARRANAAAAKEGKSNPRTSSKAQSILGKKGASAKKG